MKYQKVFYFFFYFNDGSSLELSWKDGSWLYWSPHFSDSLPFCHEGTFTGSPLLLAHCTRHWPCSTCASVLMYQCVHGYIGYTAWICVCMPPENDLQSTDLEAPRLEHNKTVVYVLEASVHCQGEQHLVLGQCKAPWELTRQIISFSLPGTQGKMRHVWLVIHQLFAISQ